MTEASLMSYAKRRKKGTGLTAKMVVGWCKELGPATAHDLYDTCRALGFLKAFEGTPSQNDQGWSEFVSRLGDAARDGYLDDSETVKAETGAYRTIYRYNEVKKPRRMTVPEQLRARIAELEDEVLRLRGY